jgi:apolipoprotein N-acyltransferase
MTPWPLAILGAVALAASQPPIDAWPLAWIAPVPWLVLVRRERAAERLGLAMWSAGLVYWLLALHWLRLPHPATSIGWVLLSCYLAIYPALFVAVARRLVHVHRLPLVAAAPLGWVGLEHARGTLLGGFTMGSIAHTQWRWEEVLQTADVIGEAGTSGLVVAVAGGLTEALWKTGDRSRASTGRWWQPTAAAGLLVAAVGYGHFRLEESARLQRAEPLSVLLVQGSIDTQIKQDPGAASDIARHYDALTVAGLDAAGERPDLIVWPETMWRYGLLEIDPRETLPEDVVRDILGPGEAGASDAAERQATARRRLEAQRLEALAAYARRYGTVWVVGLDTQILTPDAASGVRSYNSALFLDARGRVLGRYDKMFPVLFGEYVPLGDRFPWLYRLTPLPGGLTPGIEAVSIPVAGRQVAATICYETTLPEAVRGMVRDLAARGRRPDLLVNLTNDGWFWGSSELDMHLACGIFRAVESRTPLVIAANTGLSAWIDGAGRLRNRGPRRATATLLADVVPDGRRSPYLIWGGWPAAICMTVVAVVLLGRIVGVSPIRENVPVPQPGRAGTGGVDGLAAPESR